MMQRLLLSSMCFRNNLYFYKDIPFSGVGFVILQTGYIESYILEGGVISNPYVSVCDPHDGVRHYQVDLTEELTSEQSEYMNYFQFRGGDFTGIGYFFDGDVCIGECFVRDCLSQSIAFFYKNGQGQSLEISDDYLAEIYEWHPDGELELFYVSPGCKRLLTYSGSIKLSDKGEIVRLVSMDGFLDNLSSISKKVKFPIVLDISYIHDRMFGRSVSLVGCDMSEDLFKLIFKEEKWVNVESISLLDTWVIDFSIFQMPKLVDIHFNKCKDLSKLLEMICNVKKRNQKIRFFVDRVEV